MKPCLKRYPAMKDSGVGWLGPVPEHWEVRRFKFLLREQHARSASGKEQLLRVSQYTGITKRHRKDTRAESLTGYRRVAPSDLVVNIMLAWNGSLGVSPFRGIVSPAYCVYRFQASTDPHYAHYLLRSPLYRTRIKTVSTGVVESRLRLYTDDLYRIEAVLPPLPEQRAIVRFLDDAERRIRRYIRAKERLIELLEEERRTLIHEAVTGRFDVRTGQPYPAYKDSGVEWLGKVPEHWDVIALKWVLDRLIDCEHKTAPAVDTSKYRVVRTTAVRGGKLRWEGTYCTSEQAFFDWTKRGTPEPGDVIFTREAPAGEACVVPVGTQICLGQRTVLMRPKRGEFDPEFLVHMIYVGPPRDHIRLAAQGTTVGHFNMEDIGALQVLKPPFNEQRELVREIGRQTRVLDLAMAGTKRQVRLLHEYRTRLIADVVTGKVDVREAAAKLPDTYPVETGSASGTTHTGSNPHSTERHMAKEAVP